jgi:hypothetical protein
MLSTAEMTACRDLLVSARTAALWVATQFHGEGNVGAAARLRRIAAYLDVEIDDLNRLLLIAPPKPKP